MPTVWQLQLICRNKKLIIHITKGVFHHLLPFARTKQNFYRWIVTRLHFILGIIIDIGVQLSYTLFQTYDNSTMKQEIVENEVCKIKLSVYDDAFLACFETEPFP